MVRSFLSLSVDDKRKLSCIPPCSGPSRLTAGRFFWQEAGSGVCFGPLGASPRRRAPRWPWTWTVRTSLTWLWWGIQVVWSPGSAAMEAVTSFRGHAQKAQSTAVVAGHCCVLVHEKKSLLLRSSGTSAWHGTKASVHTFPISEGTLSTKMT